MRARTLTLNFKDFEGLTMEYEPGEQVRFVPLSALPIGQVRELLALYPRTGERDPQALRDSERAATDWCLINQVKEWVLLDDGAPLELPSRDASVCERLDPGTYHLLGQVLSKVKPTGDPVEVFVVDEFPWRVAVRNGQVQVLATPAETRAEFERAERASLIAELRRKIEAGGEEAEQAREMLADLEAGPAEEAPKSPKG